MFDLDIHKHFKSRRREVDISLKAKFSSEGTIALYGPSGVGKSSILRMLAGLETPDSGHIGFEEKVWFNKAESINLPIKERKIGFVFQDYNLFPNMTVSKNLSYASNNGKVAESIWELMDLTGLIDLKDDYPHELSGGQRQRVSILRALCQEPQLLLLDEPFSALDDDAIRLFIDEVKLIQTKRKMSIMVVSHRKDVIFEMADLVVKMELGKPTECGKPSDVLTRTF